MKKSKTTNKRKTTKNLDLIVDYVISTDSVVIINYVDKLREQNIGITCDELAKVLLKKQ